MKTSKASSKNASILQEEELGLDVLVHGESERNDMVEFFGENLAGYVFTEKAWVQSYGTRCVKPPIIFGDIRRENRSPCSIRNMRRVFPTNGQRDAHWSGDDPELVVSA